MRNTISQAIVIAFLGLIVSAMMSASLQAAETLTVTRDQFEFRDAPRVTEETLIGTLRAGTQVEWTGTVSGAWYEVRGPGNQLGWIHQSGLSTPRTAPTNQTTAAVTAPQPSSTAQTTASRGPSTSSLEKKIADLEKANEQYKALLDEKENRAAELTQEIEALEQRLVDTAQQASDTEQRRERQQIELSEIQSRLNELNESLKQKDEQILKDKVEYTKLQNQLATLQERPQQTRPLERILLYVFSGLSFLLLGLVGLLFINRNKRPEKMAPPPPRRPEYVRPDAGTRPTPTESSPEMPAPLTASPTISESEDIEGEDVVIELADVLPVGGHDIAESDEVVEEEAHEVEIITDIEEIDIVEDITDVEHVEEVESIAEIEDIDDIEMIEDIEVVEEIEEPDVIEELEQLEVSEEDVEFSDLEVVGDVEELEEFEEVIEAEVLEEIDNIEEVEDIEEVEEIAAIEEIEEIESIQEIGDGEGISLLEDMEMFEEELETAGLDEVEELLDLEEVSPPETESTSPLVESISPYSEPISLHAELEELEEHLTYEEDLFEEQPQAEGGDFDYDTIYGDYDAEELLVEGEVDMEKESMLSPLASAVLAEPVEVGGETFEMLAEQSTQIITTDEDEEFEEEILRAPKAIEEIAEITPEIPYLTMKEEIDELTELLELQAFEMEGVYDIADNVAAVGIIDKEADEVEEEIDRLEEEIDHLMEDLAEREAASEAIDGFEKIAVLEDFESADIGDIEDVEALEVTEEIEELTEVGDVDIEEVLEEEFEVEGEQDFEPVAAESPTLLEPSPILIEPEYEPAELSESLETSTGDVTEEAPATPKFDIELLRVGSNTAQIIELLSKIKGLPQPPSELVKQAPTMIARGAKESDARNFELLMQKLGAEVRLIQR